MRRLLLASVLAAGIAAPVLAQTGAAPGGTEAEAEAEAVTQALGQLCQEYFRPGASQSVKTYEARLPGWKVDDPPGVYAFTASGDWGRVRTVFSSEFKGGACRIAVLKPVGANAHDAAPTLAAIDAWAKTAIKADKRQKDRTKAAKGPPGALETSWKGGGIIIVAQELPAQGHRPALQIDVRKAP